MIKIGCAGTSRLGILKGLERTKKYILQHIY